MATKTKAKPAEKKTETPQVDPPGSVDPVAPPVAEFPVDGELVKVNGEWVGIDHAERSVDALREAAAEATRNRAFSVG